MKAKWFLYVFLAILLILAFFVGVNTFIEQSSKPTPSDVLVGVDVAYDSVEDIKNIVSEVKSYTNFFVVGSTGITYNATKLSEVCQYVYDSGLYFGIFAHPTGKYNQSQWVSDAMQRWGSRFYGLYAFDEFGGTQIDRFQFDNETYMLVREANNWTDAADKYVKSLNNVLSFFRVNWNVGDFPLFTSDYALYEFDYRAGYDVVLAEFAWNHSRPINVALCRGAATTRNKEWGAMITWTYDDAPYLVSGPEMYEDMVTAYQNGARYILVFERYQPNSTDGIMQQEHFEALKEFGQYVKKNPRTVGLSSDRVVYVLPKDYGYGFRGPNDTIWGLWEADNLSSQIWNDLNTLVDQYQTKMDIIYEDALRNSTFEYRKLIFWNGTTLTKG
jgi:hypothetical protein